MSKQPINLGAVEISRPAPSAMPLIPSVPAEVTPAPVEAKVLTTIRLDHGLNEGLRVLIFRTRKLKQDLIAEAITDLLAKHGIQ